MLNEETKNKIEQKKQKEQKEQKGERGLHIQIQIYLHVKQFKNNLCKKNTLLFYKVIFETYLVTEVYISQRDNCSLCKIS